MSSQTYTSIEAIDKAISVMSHETEGTTEDKVARYMTAILSYYFPVTENWTIVPESRTTDKKIPDLVVEKCIHNEFVPHIYVELKSKVSNYSKPKAVKQLATAVFLQFGDGQNNKGFLIVVRGSKIAFLEYIAYFDMGEKKHFCRTVPFNRQYSGVKDDRPTYQGEARYKFPDTTKDTYVLDVAKDHIKVHEVIYWIKDNKPRDLSAVISEDGYHYSRIPSRVTSARGPNDVQLSRRYPSGPSPGPPPFSGNEQIQVKKTKNKETVWVDVLCPFEYEGGNSVLYSFPGSRSFSMMEEDDGEDVQMS